MKRTNIIVVLTTFIIGMMIFLFGHGWIRNYGGDAIAIVFLYSLLSILSQRSILQKATAVFIFALGIELVPLWIGSPTNILRQFFLGSTFDPMDIFTYFITMLGIIGIEYAVQKKLMFSTGRKR